jgi:hypothetical protein
MKVASIARKLGLKDQTSKSQILLIGKELDARSKYSLGTAKIGAKFAGSASATDEANTFATAIAKDEIGEKHGRNREARDAELHPSLQHVLRSVKKIERWEVSNCAEVAVVNKWLVACGPSVLGKIKVSSFDKDAKPKPPCKNCSQWLVPAPGGYTVRMALAPVVPAAAVPPPAAAVIPPPAAVVVPPPAAVVIPPPVQQVSIAAIPLPRGGVAGFAEFRRLVMGDEEEWMSDEEE